MKGIHHTHPSGHEPRKSTLQEILQKLFPDRFRPNPELRPKMVQDMSESQIPEAFEEVWDMPKSDLRSQILIVLAARLKEVKSPELWRKIIASMPLTRDDDLPLIFGSMAPYLPKELHHEALQKAFSFEFRPIRIAGMVALAPFFVSESFLQEAIDHARSDDEDKLPFRRDRIAALAKLVPFLREPLQQEIIKKIDEELQAPEEFQQLDHEEIVSRVLVASKSRRLMAPSDIFDALANALKIEEPYKKVRELLDLAPYLPETLKAKALRAAFSTAKADMKHEYFGQPEIATLAAQPDVQAAIQDPSPEEFRYANLWFTYHRMEESRIERDHALVQGETIYLRFNIGSFDERTILEKARPFVSEAEINKVFPETKGKPVPLEVAVFSNDFEVPKNERRKKVSLAHRQPTKVLYFRVKPLSLGLSHLRVCVFYRNHLLQSLNVSATVSQDAKPAQEQQHAHVEMTFSADFARVDRLPARGLWIGLNQKTDGSHTLNLKGDDTVLSLNLEEKIENALTQARTALLEVSFEDKKDEDGNLIINSETGLPKRKYRFDKENFPSPGGEDFRLKRFKQDLTKLAQVGQNLYDAVFGTGAVPTAEKRKEVEPIVEKMKKALWDEQTIQIARLKKLDDIWPWALMYDLIVDPEPDHVTDVCLAFLGPDGRALPYQEGVKNCKHRDPRTGRHRDKTIVCPYGFWGFKHIIEQPMQPGGQQAFDDLVLQIKTGSNTILPMPVAAQLMDTEKDHIKNMQDLNFSPLDSLEEIISALDPDFIPPPPEPHVIYFFCHGKHDPNKNPYLQVGMKDSLLPSELDKLGFRWNNVHGLVFINGCHTVDLQPRDLSTIMAPFVKAYSSGIIGTEITVHTYLATNFAQKFFERLLSNGNKGQPVGQIIKDLRLELLTKFNPLGLIYTPYCSADLHVVR